MKKLFLFYFLFFIYLIPLKADITENPVTFTLIENFYSDVTKTYDNDTTIFTYKNELLSMNLTDANLKTILSQKSGSGSSRLTYYETLNILVKPAEGTPFEVLKGKDEFYRANGGGAWVSDIVHNQSLEDTAILNDLNNNFWPWGFGIVYRTDPDGTFTKTIPSGVDLTNKSLEEQLATLLDIDLETDPDGVVDEYKNLWKFRALNNYTYLLRFDFLTEKNGVTPDLISGDEYSTDSLDNMGTYYVAIKYESPEETPASLIVSESKNNTLWFIIPCLGIILATTFYLFKKNVIKFH